MSRRKERRRNEEEEFKASDEAKEEEVAAADFPEALPKLLARVEGKPIQYQCQWTKRSQKWLRFMCWQKSMARTLSNSCTHAIMRQRLHSARRRLRASEREST